MVDAAPEESVTLPDFLGSGKLALRVNVGTGMGWVSGHNRVPSLCNTLRAMCARWFLVSSSPLYQSGKTMRTPSMPLLHIPGGSFEPAVVSSVPQYHLTIPVITFRSAGKGFTVVRS